LSRVRTGDSQALGEMYDTYAPRIYRFLYRRLGDAHLAEDLTGDVFLRALAALRNGRFAADDLAPWLFQIARNRMIDHFRRTPPGRVETWDDRLGDQFDEGLSAIEVADKLGSSAQAVRAMQYRALTALRRLFFDGSPNPLSWST
jgi:RNA polymerase sigma-70 factor (ECF subfamily)